MCSKSQSPNTDNNNSAKKIENIVPETQELSEDLSPVKLTNSSLTCHDANSYLKILEERNKLKQELDIKTEECRNLQSLCDSQSDQITEMTDVITNLTEELEKQKTESDNLLLTISEKSQIHGKSM